MHPSSCFIFWFSLFWGIGANAVAQDCAGLRALLHMEADSVHALRSSPLLLDIRKVAATDAEHSGPYELYLTNQSPQRIEIDALGFAYAFESPKEGLVLEAALRQPLLRRSQQFYFTAEGQPLVIEANSKLTLAYLSVQAPSRKKARQAVKLVAKCGYVRWKVPQQVATCSEIALPRRSLKVTSILPKVVKQRIPQSIQISVRLEADPQLADLAFGFEPVSAEVQCTNKQHYDLKIRAKWEKPRTCTVIDPLGEVIFSKVLTVTEPLTFELNYRKKWAAGTYYYKITATDGQVCGGTLLTIP